LIGVPDISSKKFGAYRMSSVSVWQQLTLGGLAIAATLNLLAASFFLRKSKDRRLCWCWSAVYSVLLLVEYLVFAGQIDFGWLKDFLRRFAS